MAGSSCSFDLLDFIDHFGPKSDSAKDAVTNAVLRVLFIEETVVFGVDKELAGGAVWHAGPSHSDRVLEIRQAIGRFVFDRLLGPLLLHVWGKATTLNHEARDYTVENGPVVVTFFRVGKEILNGDGSRFRIQLDRDVTLVRFHDDRSKRSWHGLGFRKVGGKGGTVKKKGQ